MSRPRPVSARGVGIDAAATDALRTFTPRPPSGARPASGGGGGPSRPGGPRGRPHSAGVGTKGGPAGTLDRTGGGGGGPGGRRLLPAEIGLAGRRVLSLPSHVEQCDQGEQCCWRWLAHAVLKEASWLREDLDAHREEHSQYTKEKQKAEHDAEAYAELRGAHSETTRELKEAREEVVDLRRELAAQKTAHAHKTAREQELMRDTARLEKERRDIAAAEASASKRAEDSEREFARAKAAEEELNQRVLHLENAKARLGADLDEAKTERDRLRLGAEEKDKKKKRQQPQQQRTGAQSARGRRAPGDTARR